MSFIVDLMNLNGLYHTFEILAKYNFLISNLESGC
jgi:hypothetical protein